LSKTFTAAKKAAGFLITYVAVDSGAGCTLGSICVNPPQTAPKAITVLDWAPSVVTITIPGLDVRRATAYILAVTFLEEADARRNPVVDAPVTVVVTSAPAVLASSFISPPASSTNAAGTLLSMPVSVYAQ
jgi:hypothetical protein